MSIPNAQDTVSAGEAGRGEGPLSIEACNCHGFKDYSAGGERQSATCAATVVPQSSSHGRKEITVADNSEEYVSAVNDVISICKDAEEGFRGAANAVENTTLKSMFEEYSGQRAGFARELQAAVREQGAEAATPAGVAGTLHRGWMALKGALTGHSEHQILEETERGEDLSKKRYQEALSKQMPAQIRTIVQRQYDQVLQAHDRIKSLRDSTARGSTA